MDTKASNFQVSTDFLREVLEIGTHDIIAIAMNQQNKLQVRRPVILRRVVCVIPNVYTLNIFAHIFN